MTKSAKVEGVQTEERVAEGFETRSGAAVQPVGFDRSRVRTVKHVTLPLLKVVAEREYYVRVDAAIYQAKEIAGARAKTAAQEKMAPPKIANVTNLETGEAMMMIFPSVLDTELHDQYPDDGYVGRCFMLIKHEKATGKRYATFTIEEIEVED